MFFFKLVLFLPTFLLKNNCPLCRLRKGNGSNVIKHLVRNIFIRRNTINIILMGVAKNLSFFQICQLLDQIKHAMHHFSIFSYTFYKCAILFCNIYSFWDNGNYIKLVRGTLWRAKNIQYFVYIAEKCSILFKNASI